jgi:hypothetical protein
MHTYFCIRDEVTFLMVPKMLTKTLLESGLVQNRHGWVEHLVGGEHDVEQIWVGLKHNVSINENVVQNLVPGPGSLTRKIEKDRFENGSKLLSLSRHCHFH